MKKIFFALSAILLFSTSAFAERYVMVTHGEGKDPFWPVVQKGGEDAARAIGADFEYEREMALTNREMNSEIDTICLISSLKFQYVSSSRIKEIASFGGDVKSLIPEHVYEPFMERINKSV